MPHPQDNARILFIVIILFWLATSPDNGPGLIAAPSLTRARLARQRNSHGVLNSTSWGDFAPKLPTDPIGTAPRYLNLTGFRANDTFAWDYFGIWKDTCTEWSRHAVGERGSEQPVWQNATGVVKGNWVRRPGFVQRWPSSYNLTEMTPKVDWMAWGTEWGRNVTGTEGSILMRLEDNEGSEVEYENPLEKDLAKLKSQIVAREVSATVTLEDDAGSGGSWEMRLHGVHWPRQGAVLLTTTSEKYAGIFGLPHLTIRQDFFNSSQSLLNRTLDKMLRKKEKHSFSDPVSPWTSSVDLASDAWTPTPHCEYMIYAQIYPPQSEVLHLQSPLSGPEHMLQTIRDIEDELRFPQGAPIHGIPQLQMSSVVYSPDCAFFLESKGPPHFPALDGNHLQGLKQETFLHNVSTTLLGLALIIFGQVQLLKVQMREASTPSTLGRISFYTAAIMLLADGIIFAGSAAWSLSASNTFLPSLTVTCAGFLSMTVGVAFLGEIYKVQEPEWRRRVPPQAPTPNTPRPPATPANTRATTTPGSLPMPATANTNRRAPSPPIIIPSDQDLDAEITEQLTAPPAAVRAAGGTQPTTTPITTIFGRFIMAGITTLFLTLAALSWRPTLQTIYFTLLAMTYLSLWVPQIYRNIHRSCRRALSFKFVIGQSILRLAPISYFYLVSGKDNIVFAEPDIRGLYLMIAWLWCQIWVLVAQSVIGPRFGFKFWERWGWFPEAWEYHPVLREDAVEGGGLPIGLVSAGNPDSEPGTPTLERARTGEDSKDKKMHTRVVDCAICREILEVPVVRAGDAESSITGAAAGGVAGMFARRLYMVTPCRHIFHSECLEGWMRFRLQCPICREDLPPL